VKTLHNGKQSQASVIMVFLQFLDSYCVYPRYLAVVHQQ